MGDIEIRGADQFQALGKRIRQHADKKALQKELYAGLNRETKEVREAMKKSIPEALPSGFGEKVARESGIQTRSRGGGSGVGVRIITGKRHALRTMNDGGYFRHPVYGNRNNWVTQRISGKFLDAAFEKGAPGVRKALLKVMADVARKVEGGR